MIETHLGSRVRLGVVAVLVIAVATACGAKVAGSTYSGNGGIVKIEFKSDGKAYVSTGPVTTNCTYTEKGKSLTLVCEGDATEFTIDDGALNGPEGSMLSRLTKTE
jgi:hypothetical protein